MFRNSHGYFLSTSVAVLLCHLFYTAVGSESDDYSESNQEKGSQVEVRAVFINCETDEALAAADSDLLRFQRQELFKHSALRDCRKKVALTVKLTSDPGVSWVQMDTSKPRENSGDEYIPIDHVLQGTDRKRVRLLNPYILRLRREAPLQAYKLQQIDTVSGVLTKTGHVKVQKETEKRSRSQRNTNDYPDVVDEWSEFLGSASGEFTLEHDEFGRHSYSVRIGNQQGMPATAYSNMQMSKDCGLRLFAEPTPSPPVLVKPSQPEHARDKRDCVKNNRTIWIRDKRHKQNMLPMIGGGMKLNRNSPKKTKDHGFNRFDRVTDTFDAFEEVSNDNFEKPLHKNKDSVRPLKDRQRMRLNNYLDDVKSKFNESVESVQSNTGVNDAIITDSSIETSDRNSRKTVEPKSHVNKSDVNSDLESTVRDFALYEIGNPNIWYSVQVQIFEKLSTLEGKTVWNDMTKGQEASVSSTSPEWSGQDVNVQYRPADWVARDDFSLPMTSLCLLEPIHDSNFSLLNDDYVSDPNNSYEYIIVPVEDVVGIEEKNNLNKRDFNSTDFNTSYSINEEQHHRRVEVRVARALFGSDSDNFNITSQGSDRFLTFPHQKPHHAQLDLELRADDNELVRVGSSGRIATVVADNSRKTRTIVTLQATNTGLASARFRAVTRDCGPELSGLLDKKGSDGTVTGPILLPPRHTRRLRLELPTEIPTEIAHCVVALLNDDDDTVAIRDVTIKKGDRCFCIWHCDCVCLSEDPKLLCREMPVARQVAAGLSTRNRPRRARFACYNDNVTVNSTIVIFGVLLSLLMFGTFKAILGLECRCVGQWGLERLLMMPRKIDHYHERTLFGREVVYDEEGWPVHPDTKKRTVRLVSRPMEFLLNIILFIAIPCIVLCSCIGSMVNYCMACIPKRNGPLHNNIDAKKCFSSQDIQSVEMILRRKRRANLRRWMTPHAEELSANLWKDGLAPQVPPNKDTMQPLLHEVCRSKSEEVEDCEDSEQDDTEYVLMQMQKSRESLARSQKKLNDTSRPSSAKKLDTVNKIY